MHRSNKISWFFLGFSAVIAVSALVLLFTKRNSVSPPPAPPPGVTGTDPSPPPIPSLDTPLEPDDPATILKDLGIGVGTTDPAELVNRIAKALEAGDLATVARLIGKDALDAATLEKLHALAAGRAIKLRQPDGVREIGEIELNALARWALELDGKEAGRDRILLDLRRKDGKWSVEKLTLPPDDTEPIPRAALADSLGITDAFLQSVLRQDFEFARQFVDPVTVSDAKIAALCILFEEGEYRLRSSKPLRAMFQRDDTVGYLANVEGPSPDQTAQFGITLRQPSQPANWVVSEINLDQLIADYTRRVAGGDIYYSPLVRNPQGGDTLALYFEFDEDRINPRTRRQLEIVTLILRSDPGRKITLSGHTDSLGSDAYNDELSARRAAVVSDYLAKAGVDESQIVTLAKGASQPRRPNVTESGEDDPQGRRANRRTEIYLDF